MTNKQNIVDVLSKISASLEKQNDLQQEMIYILKYIHFTKDKNYGIIQNCAKAISIARGALAFYEKNKHFASSKQDRQYFENFSHSYHGFSCYMWSDPLERFSLKVESGGIARQALAQMDEVKGGAQ